MSNFSANKEEIIKLITLSEDILKSAKSRLKEEFFRGSVSDSYYAAFYVAKAALLAKNVTSKTHKGTIRLFGENFVKKGLIDKKYGKWFNDLFEGRTKATYDVMLEVNEEKAKKDIELAKEFVKEVKNVLKI